MARWREDAYGWGIHVLDLKTGRMVAEFADPNLQFSPFTPLCFSPDSSRLAISGYRVVQVRDIATGRLVTSLKHEMDVNAVTFSPDGKTIVTACDDWGHGRLEIGPPLLTVWDAATGAPQSSFKKPGWQYIERIVFFSPDGQIAALSTGASGYDLLLWDMAAGRVVRRITDGAHRPFVFSPDGKMLATESWRGIELLDVGTGRNIRTLSPLPRSLGWRELAFSADGREVLATGHRRRQCAHRVGRGIGRTVAVFRIEAKS